MFCLQFLETFVEHTVSLQESEESEESEDTEETFNRNK